MKPKITIGIPFFNAEDTILYSTASVIAQTYKNWELILVDDGSTDGSLQIVKKIDDPRIRILSDGQNRNLSVRLNQISQMAKAPYLARMDADDIMHPQRLQKQLDYLSTHVPVDIVGTGAYIIDGNNRVVGKRLPDIPHKNKWKVASKGMFIHPSIMGRTEWFLNNPYCEENWCTRIEDLELWMRTCEKSTFHNLPTLLLYYRDPGGFGMESHRLSKKNWQKVVKKHGIGNLSLWQKTTLLIKERFKQFIITAIPLFGLGELIRKCRNKHLVNEEYIIANDFLSASLLPTLMHVHRTSNRMLK